MMICIFVLLVTEWIDFPRCEQLLPDGKFIPGNNNSYDKCRRRFDLVSTISLSTQFWSCCFFSTATYEAFQVVYCIMFQLTF
jgi:hypothetical protein